MARTRSFNRWTEVEREILRDCWPRMHEQEVLARLGGNRTIISVRAKATHLGLKKGPERWGRGSFGNLLSRVEELQVRLRESETVCQLLREKVQRLEAQLLATSARSAARRY